MKIFRITKYTFLIILVAFTILLNWGQGYLLKQDIVYSDRLILIKIVLTWLIVPFILVISYGSFMSRKLGDSRAVVAIFISNGIIIFIISIAFVVRLIHFVFIEERPLYDTDIPGMMLYYEPLNPYLYKRERRSIGHESTLQSDDARGRRLAETDDIAAICVNIYDEAIRSNTFGSLEMMRNIIRTLGENGYASVDDENQIDMAKSDQVVNFCESVDSEEEAELTIIVVSYQGGFTKYDFTTRNGNVDILKEYYQYVDGHIEHKSTGSYRANTWEYSEEGYLLFEGCWLSEEYYVLTLSEVPDRVALRVKPLDGKCRELNRQYVLPISYDRNNMFMTDWNEDDYGELDFYDLYDIFYPMVNNRNIPYVADENLGVGTTYRIPKEEFESVIMAYFKVDSQTLQSKTIYHYEDSAYEYRPRGFYEVEYSEMPYPEVVKYAENDDGTITLTVNVIYPNEMISKVYAHEVVIRPLDDRVQYVSNHIIPSNDNYGQTWHVPRLTEEEWEKIYGEEAPYWFFPKVKDCIITEEEKGQLQNIALSAAGQVKEIYRNIEIIDDSLYLFKIKNFTGDQCKEVVARLGGAGYVSITEDANMENYEDVEGFYSAYLENRDAMVSIFEPRRDGLIGMITFIYRENKLQTYYVEIGWQEGGIPKIRNTLVSDIGEIKLTEKGYFIYAYEIEIAHSSLRQYWRIKSLSDECRELTKKYIYGLSYVNYNVLVTNWDSSNVEDILMPCMFEDIYRIYTGENLKTQNGRIPAEIYEQIMTTYFPVSTEQLREKCGYDENSSSYEYEMIFGKQYPPFGEVVDYKYNADGTITLIVDAVWADYNSDQAFTNTIVVQPFNDGTFRYLSNSVEQKELELPLIAN